MYEESGRRRPGLGYRRHRRPGPMRGVGSRPGRNGGRRDGHDRGPLAVTLGVAAACWVVAARETTGMDMGTTIRLRSFGFFGRRVGGDDAAGHGPGSAQAHPGRRRARAVPVFTRSYLTVWALAGTVVVCALYRPHGVLGRRRGRDRGGCLRALPAQAALPSACREGAGSGLGFEVCYAGSSIGADGDAGGAGHHEHHLDDGDHRPGPRPEATARQRRRRWATGAGDHRTWNPDHYGAIDGAWTHATDVRGRR
jgi:hypothetical protein